jgi:hypothetical protein
MLFDISVTLVLFMLFNISVTLVLFMFRTFMTR